MKFRVFNKETNQFRGDDCVIDQSGKLWEFNKEGLFNLNPEVNIVQQFTGLKDKNGKEIYEGDIIKGETSASSTKIIGEVNFCYKYSHFGVLATEHSYYNRNNIPIPLSNFFIGGVKQYLAIQVIGNIFENA